MPQSTILCNLNLNGNEIRNVALESLASHPQNSKVSRIYFNSTDNCVYVLQSTSPDKWVRLNGVEFKANPNDNTKTIAYLNADSVELSTGATATGLNAVAEGSGTATGNYSHAEGNGDSELDIVEFTPTALTQAQKTDLKASFGLDFDYIDESDSLDDGVVYTIFSDEGCTQKVAEMAHSKYVEAPEGDAFKLKTFVELSGTYYAKRVTGASGSDSHSEGSATAASGVSSHSEGDGTTASGTDSHAEGSGTIASGIHSHSEGSYTIASDNSSHAEGTSSLATGTYSHAEGNGAFASGSASHAENFLTTASGTASHAEGSFTTASGDCSHVEGENSVASGDHSHAEGVYTIAGASGAHAEGKYNQSLPNGIHMVGIGTANNARKNAHLITDDGKHYIVGVGGYQGTETTLTGIKDLASVLTANEAMESITWSALKAKRDGGTLIPGKQYRITDYTTTTTQTDTQSAGHVFDVIVVADSTNTINENARAIQHAGDTYFSSSNLKAWELKYSLDNDTTKFEWADSTNGKGVIYWMKDEARNECPYDFKNIQYVYVKSFKIYHPSYGKTYYGKYKPNGNNTVINNVTYYECDRIEYKGGPYTPPEKVWTTVTTFTDSMSLYSVSGTTVSTLYYPIFDVVNNNFIVYTFDVNDSSDYSLNGSYCYGNKIGMYISSNKQKLSFNMFRNTYNTSKCYNNTFGDNCYNNTFGNDCCSNTFGNNCYNNSFGEYCNSITFGEYCSNNSFENDCNYNLFRNNYIQLCSFKDGVKNCSITGYTTGSSNYLQNIIVLNGTQGTSISSRLALSDLTVGADYCQVCGKNSSGTYTHKNILD